MKIRPLHDRVIVRREKRNKHRLEYPLAKVPQEKPNRGEVVAVGSGHILDSGDVRAVDVKIGDIVVFGQYAGNDKIDVDGEELIILSESDIKAVIEG